MLWEKKKASGWTRLKRVHSIVNSVRQSSLTRVDFTTRVSRWPNTWKMKFGSWSWRQAGALEEIKRREREFNFGTGEWQQESSLFSIIRSRYEIDCCSAGGKREISDTLTSAGSLSRAKREIKVEFESGNVGNSIKTRSRSRSYLSIPVGSHRLEE